MRIVTRNGQKYRGEFIVFDSMEEALGNGVSLTEVGNRYDFKNLPRSKVKREVPKWFIYDDGVVAQVLHAGIGKISCSLQTALGQVNPNKTGKILSTEDNWIKHSFDMDLGKITKNRFKFAQAWLFEGMPIEVAAKEYMSQEYRRFSRQLEAYRAYGYDELDKARFTLVMFGYFSISQAWFENLLQQNRVFKDKYMSLVHAFDQAGLTDAYIAEYIKKKLENEATDKASVSERLAAFNKAVEIRLTAEARVPKGKELPSDLVRFLDERKAIPEEAGRLPESFADLIKEVEDVTKEGITETTEGHESVRPSTTGLADIPPEEGTQASN